MAYTVSIDSKSSLGVRRFARSSHSPDRRYAGLLGQNINHSWYKPQ